MSYRLKIANTSSKLILNFQGEFSLYKISEYEKILKTLNYSSKWFIEGCK